MSSLGSLRLLVWVGLLFGLATPMAGRQPDGRVTLHAVGDVLLTRGIGRKIAAHGEDYPFRSIAPTLRKAHIVIGNLECALSDRPFATNQQFRFRAAPDRARLLRQAGFTTMNLANNHALDCGPDGLQDTMDALAVQQIGWCGVGANEPEPLLSRYNGVTIGFLSFSDFPPSRAQDGTPSLCYASETVIKRSVGALRTYADVVVVSFHWGSEQHARPTARQRHLARVTAQAGADLVLGHHPHVLQGFEVLRFGRRKTLVAYSLGSFLFDGHKEAEKQSLILKCSLGKGGLEGAEIFPVRVDHSAPRRALGREASTILSRLRRQSGELGTRLEGALITLTQPMGARDQTSP